MSDSARVIVALNEGISGHPSGCEAIAELLGIGMGTNVISLQLNHQGSNHHQLEVGSGWATGLLQRYFVSVAQICAWVMFRRLFLSSNSQQVSNAWDSLSPSFSSFTGRSVRTSLTSSKIRSEGCQS